WDGGRIRRPTHAMSGRRLRHRPEPAALQPSGAWMTDLRLNRRRALQSLAAAVSAAALPRPAVAQGAGPHIVVVGGGFGGASCARALKAGAPNLSVTLVETNPVYFAPPMSNAA